MLACIPAYGCAIQLTRKAEKPVLASCSIFPTGSLPAAAGLLGQGCKGTKVNLTSHMHVNVNVNVNKLHVPLAVQPVESPRYPEDRGCVTAVLQYACTHHRRGPSTKGHYSGAAAVAQHTRCGRTARALYVPAGTHAPASVLSS